MPQRHIHTSFGFRLGDHFKAFQWLPLACNIPTKVTPELLATTKPPGPPPVPYGCWLQPNPYINIQMAWAPTQSTPLVGMPRLVPTTYWARPYPYMLMVVLHGWPLHEPVLRFGYDNKPEATGSNQTQPRIAGSNQTQFPLRSPQILISRIPATLKNKSMGDLHEITVQNSTQTQDNSCKAKQYYPCTD
jgi:hypothetical protein